MEGKKKILKSGAKEMGKKKKGRTRGFYITGKDVASPVSSCSCPESPIR